jgi:hypothetical protein
LKAKHDPRIVLPVLLVIAGAAFLVLIPVIRPKADFHNELWGPAQLLMRGESPYDTSALNPELPAVWFPMAVGVFSPLGLATESTASRIWLLLSLVELSLILWIAARKSPSTLLAPAAALLVLLFPPTIHHLSLGQFSITAALCLLLSAYFAGKGSEWPAAALLALGLSKPQLGVLAAFGLAVFYFRQGGIARALNFGMKTAFACLGMSLPLFAAYPNWVPDWIQSLQSNDAAWLHPSPAFILQEFLGDWGYLPWGLLTSAIFLACYRIWTGSPRETAMCWSLGLTPLVTPYIWSWDFVLVLPAWIHTFFHVSWRGKLFLFLTYLAGCLGMAVIQLSGDNNNSRFWWVPIWFIGTAALVAFPTRLQAKT